MPGTYSKSSEHARAAGPVGRTLRVALGVLLLGSIGGFYVSGTGQFVFRSLAVAIGLVVVYLLFHRLVSTRPPGLGPWLGAILALAPIVLVYALGIGGGAIFGAGEGQLGALTFLAVSLLVAGLRGDTGCEVMAVPNALSGRRAHLACLLFSPVDRLERRSSDGGRAP